MARALAGRPEVQAVLSLAGRTAVPLDLPIATRTGGFGGADGLAAYLAAAAIDVLVDATHPFAARMSATAAAVATRLGLPLIRLTRPGWQASVGDRWEEVDDMAAAAAALGPTRRHAFLTVGRLQLAAFAGAPQHRYLVRTIDPVGPGHGLRDALFVQARGPFAVEDEERTMRAQAIDVLVTKNSGGAAAAAKLEAARRLGLPVVLVRRPIETGATVADVAAVLVALDAHGSPRASRGV